MGLLRCASDAGRGVLKANSAYSMPEPAYKPGENAKRFIRFPCMGIMPDLIRVLDLGPYSGPPLTLTPVILNEGRTIDLTLQATVFWLLGDAP